MPVRFSPGRKRGIPNAALLLPFVKGIVTGDSIGSSFHSTYRLRGSTQDSDGGPLAVSTYSLIVQCTTIVAGLFSLSSIVVGCAACSVHMSYPLSEYACRACSPTICDRTGDPLHSVSARCVGRRSARPSACQTAPAISKPISRSERLRALRTLQPHTTHCVHTAMYNYSVVFWQVGNNRVALSSMHCMLPLLRFSKSAMTGWLG